MKLKSLLGLFSGPKFQSKPSSPTSQGKRADGRENTKYRAKGWQPQPGYTRNLLLDYPRNQGCFCGSGDKAKVCCLPYQPRAAKIKGVQILRANWEKILSGEVILPPAPGSKREKLMNFKKHKEQTKEESQKEMLADLKKGTA